MTPTIGYHFIEPESIKAVTTNIVGESKDAMAVVNLGEETTLFFNTTHSVEDLREFGKSILQLATRLEIERTI